MLEIKNVTKKFKKQLVLDDISFDIKNKEIITLLGANGAGKTTLINCILKLYKIDSGQIKFDNTDIYKLSSKSYYSDISVVLESSDNVYDYLSGIDNIKYFMGLSKIKFETYKDNMNSFIDLFELKDHIDKKVGNYSRGMQQKLAIIIALLSNPKLLILDEPTLGLDIKTKYNMLSILKKIVHERDISILLTTHQMEVVEALDSKLMILDKGKIREFGNIKELMNNYIEYHIKYFDENKKLIEKVIGGKSFEEIFEEHRLYNIISIDRKEKNIEDVIMEELYG